MYKCIFTLSLLLVFAGCSSEQRPSAITETATVKSINLKVATTIGNHTYIPLNLKEIPGYNVPVILQVLDEFEKTHPELKVTDWKPEWQQSADRSSAAFTFGIWIDHEPKVTPLAWTDHGPEITHPSPRPSEFRW